MLFLHRRVFGARGAGAPFRLFDLEVHAGVVLYADDPQKRTDGFRGGALTADDLTHILGIHVKREQYAHLVDLAVNLHIIRMIHERFHQILEKLLIC